MNDNDNLKNIFRDGVLFDVHVSKWPAAGRMQAEHVGLEDKDIEADAFEFGHIWLLPKAVRDKFGLIEGRARRAAGDLGLPFPIGSANYVPRPNIPELVERLKGFQKDFSELAEDLRDNYLLYRQQMVPTYRKQAEKAWFQHKAAGVQTFSIEGEEADKEKYISEYLAKIDLMCPPVETLVEKFQIDYSLFEVGQTTGEFASNDLKDKISTFIDDVVGQLRGETVKICHQVTNAIKDGKVIRSTTIESLKRFIDKFKNMNFVGDKLIEEQLAEIKRDFLDTQSAEQLSTPEMQVELKRKLNLISEAAANVTDRSSVSGGYRRKINWQ